MKFLLRNRKKTLRRITKRAARSYHSAFPFLTFLPNACSFFSCRSVSLQLVLSIRLLASFFLSFHFLQHFLPRNHSVLQTCLPSIFYFPSFFLPRPFFSHSTFITVIIFLFIPTSKSFFLLLPFFPSSFLLPIILCNFALLHSSSHSNILHISVFPRSFFSRSFPDINHFSSFPIFPIKFIFTLLHFHFFMKSFFLSVSVFLGSLSFFLLSFPFSSL